MAAARKATSSTTHQRFWDTARKQLVDGPGTRTLIGVLLLHHTQPRDGILAGMQTAVAMGRFDPELVAIEASRLAPERTTEPVILPATVPPAALHQRPAP